MTTCFWLDRLLIASASFSFWKNAHQTSDTRQTIYYLSKQEKGRIQNKKREDANKKKRIQNKKKERVQNKKKEDGKFLKFIKTTHLENLKQEQWKGLSLYVPTGQFSLIGTNLSDGGRENRVCVRVGVCKCGCVCWRYKRAWVRKFENASAPLTAIVADPARQALDLPPSQSSLAILYIFSFRQQKVP